jgi:hypothetical protein
MAPTAVAIGRLDINGDLLRSTRIVCQAAQNGFGAAKDIDAISLAPGNPLTNVRDCFCDCAACH